MPPHPSLRPATHHGPQGRIEAEALGVVDILVATQRRALEQASARQPGLVAPLEERLRLYESGRPYREVAGLDSATRPGGP